MIDYKHLSKAELIEIIKAQAAAIADLKTQLAECKLGSRT